MLHYSYASPLQNSLIGCQFALIVVISDCHSFLACKNTCNGSSGQITGVTCMIHYQKRKVSNKEQLDFKIFILSV